MPVLEVRVVGELAGGLDDGLAQRIADAAAEVLGSRPRGTWVTVDMVAAERYGENGGVEAGVAPVFVRVLLRDGPPGADAAERVAALTGAVAGCCGRAPENVHIIFEPAAAGRVAFGGRLVEP
jgi:phenylpyruvate tautomerase PptA (4-oxalocrotonate tautomerase family)